MMRTPFPLRALACVALCVAAGSVQAALFADDDARRAIIEQREQLTGINDALEQGRRAVLQLQGQLDALRAELAAERGKTEALQNQVEQLQRSQKDYYGNLDARIKQVEPQPTVIEGVEGIVGPTERAEYDAALKAFRDGNYSAALTAFGDFARLHPKSPYLPLVIYWQGSAQYARRDYKAAVATLQGFARSYPQHPRLPDALLLTGISYAESSQAGPAKKLFEQIVAQYGASDAAKAARERLKAR